MGKPIVTITGPTGIGKTALSMELARELDGEIVSADSRQIYIDLSIGTAKPSEQSLAAVPHHFINERRLDEPISAGEFANLAEARIDSIQRTPRTPIIVGGSTLYLHALQHGIADIPSVPDSVRQNLINRLRNEGGEALFRELETRDPGSARTMDATKTQRILRALEVLHGTGRPLSYYHAHTSPPRHEYLTFVLSMDRRRLYQRIERRVDAMLASGLKEEVEQLLARGIDASLPVLRTIGYQEIIGHLMGDYGHDEMVRLLKRNTRRYAKRQLTWFRRFEEYIWIDLDTTDADPTSIIMEKYRSIQ